MSIKTLKNGPQKLLIIGPNPFISQSSPDHSPQPRIDFSYYEISGPDISHSRFGHYFCSNLYGRAPRGPSTDKRTDICSRPSCIYTQIFSPKKNWVFPHKKILSKIFLTFVYLYSMQLFSADPKIFSKKKKKSFVHKKTGLKSCS